ncbi:MAG: GntR family transcriptional regulator, partial [Deltaproteobacteria bacterium]|nr:GntR family transcriptional regulator [Deltaproteobacteria bacterium]
MQPLYHKIKTFIVEKIDRGEWQIGAKISSEAELVAHFGTSRMT